MGEWKEKCKQEKWDREEKWQRDQGKGVTASNVFADYCAQLEEEVVGMLSY